MPRHVQPAGAGATVATEEPLPRVQRLAAIIRRGSGKRDLAFLTRIIDAVADPIFVKDDQLRFLLVNQSLCQFTGLARERFIGHTDADLFPAEHARGFNEIDRLVLQTGQPIVNEERLTHADGTVRTIRTTKTTFTDEDGNRILVGILTDLTALRAIQRKLETANVQLRELAHRDRLTSLPNRMAFEERLAETVAASQRRGATFSVLFMDLNGFKQVNDTHGHHFGDELIRATAKRLVAVAREGDFLARIGGDEFVMVAPTRDQAEARQLAERLACEVGRPYRLRTIDVAISVSIGIAAYPADGQDDTSLIRRADSAMYRAKRVTLRSYEFFDASHSALAERQYQLESQLRLDIGRGRLDIHLQPIVRLDDGAVMGFEALARWRHPKLGVIAPIEFIPLAEKTGLIDGLGRVVLQRACEFIVRHGKPGQYVSVNVSGRQLEAGDFASQVLSILEQTGARPMQLALELTESSLDLAHTTATLQSIREAGVLLFLDDFGVGYSNLTRLQHLSFDVIKIDRAFISEMGRAAAQAKAAGAMMGGPACGRGRSGCGMVRAIIAMATELGLAIIAEGIEHEHELRALLTLGVSVGQGYYLGRPAPAEDEPAAAEPADRAACLMSDTSSTDFG